MSQLDEVSAWVEKRLPELIAEHQVPAAAVAVYAGGEMVEHAAGVLSKATGVEATTDSVFQIGSITKLWTTTLVMQLADEGSLDLDSRVRTYLPDFSLSDEDAAAQITVRQLLCHTAGFEGDIFTDTGTGDDCVEKFVDTLGEVSQLFEPGKMFSYNNAGFCVLGRIVEVLRGKPYDACLREYLFTPLQLSHAATGPYEAILHRAAVGHIEPEPGAEPQPAPVWALARSNVPAGAMLAMSPRDLLTFARMHLDAGKGPDDTQVLSATSANAMQQRRVELPYFGVMGDAWGLGHEIFDWPGGPVIGHDGGTIGQSAFLRMVPGKDVAVALLTNGGNPHSVYQKLFRHVLRELAGVDVPAFPTPKPMSEPMDVSRYAGVYSSDVADTTVSQDEEGRVWAERTPKGIAVEIGAQPEKLELLALSGDTLVTAEEQYGIHLPFVFVSDSDAAGAHAQYLHTGRADRWTGEV